MRAAKGISLLAHTGVGRAHRWEGAGDGRMRWVHALGGGLRCDTTCDGQVHAVEGHGVGGRRRSTAQRGKAYVGRPKYFDFASSS